MKAISITQSQNMMIDQITQPLLQKINETGAIIGDFLLHGAVQSATESVRELSSWVEDRIWEAYLTALFQCKIILSWLRVLGGQKGLRFTSYQEIRISLPTGTKIKIRSPFFVKAAPKRGRKKSGPQNRGEHLLLSLMGFVHKVESELAFRAVQLAVLAPSFDIASKVLKQEGIELNPNKIRQLVSHMASPDLSLRVQRLLSDEEKSPFENQRVLIAVDGGRLRQRKNKRGPWPKGNKRCGFHTDWVEPKLFTLHVLDAEGNIVKEIAPFVDGTTGKLKEFMELLEQYLTVLEIEKASEVVLVGDGAPWIWERLPNLIRSIGGDQLKLTEIIDWTHAKQNLNKAFETLSKKKQKQVDFDFFIVQEFQYTHIF